MNMVRTVVLLLAFKLGREYTVLIVIPDVDFKST